MVWIRTIRPADATGRLKEAYDWQAQRLGEPTEFARLGSLDAEHRPCPADLVQGDRERRVGAHLPPARADLLPDLDPQLHTALRVARPHPTQPTPARTTSSGSSTVATMAGSTPPTPRWRAMCTR